MIILLTSVTGSPGVTTCALGLGLAWKGDTLLVEADPSGSAIWPGYLATDSDKAGGLLSVPLSPGDPVDAVLEGAAHEVSEVPRRRIVLGVRSPAQAPALGEHWEAIGEALRDFSAAGTTVIVDAGRVTQGSWPEPLLQVVDSVLVVCAPTLVSAVKTQPMVAPLRQAMAGCGNPDGIGLAVVGARRLASLSGGDEYPAADIGRELGLPVLMQIPEGAKAAAVLAHGTAGRYDGSVLARAFIHAAHDLSVELTKRRGHIVEEIL